MIAIGYLTMRLKPFAKTLNSIIFEKALVSILGNKAVSSDYCKFSLFNFLILSRLILEGLFTKSLSNAFLKLTLKAVTFFYIKLSESMKFVFNKVSFIINKAILERFPKSVEPITLILANI